MIQNIALLEKFVRRYREVMTDETLSSLLTKYRDLPEAYFLKCGFENGVEDEKAKDSEKSWGSSAYVQSKYKIEAKNQLTSRGLRVRSKSEVLIAEKLYEYGIEFHYEEVLTIGREKGREKFAPDFTIKTGKDRLFYWEHCGMTGNKSYMCRHKEKLEKYEMIGIVPWKNLIVTYDDEDGNIDLCRVEAEIKSKLCAGV